jgi:hypothetical protein
MRGFRRRRRGGRGGITRGDGERVIEGDGGGEELDGGIAMLSNVRGLSRVRSELTGRERLGICKLHRRRSFLYNVCLYSKHSAVCNEKAIVPPKLSSSWLPRIPLHPSSKCGKLRAKSDSGRIDAPRSVIAEFSEHKRFRTSFRQSRMTFLS